MYSLPQKTMLCVNCFRDSPIETRQQCIDVDTAYTQAVMKLESAISVGKLSFLGLQNPPLVVL